MTYNVILISTISMFKITFIIQSATSQISFGLNRGNEKVYAESCDEES